MDSLRSTHARLAALVRHRGPDDPEVDAARAELALHLSETRRIRDRLDSLTPDDRGRLLALLTTEGSAAA